MTTLKQVAEMAGVSISTVSRILRGDTSLSVSGDTRDRIWRCVTESGYKYNANANTSSGKLSIGYILTVTKEKFEDAFFSKIIYGMEKEIISRKCNLSFAYTMLDLENPLVLNDVLNSGCDGLIFIGCISHELYDLLIERIPHCVSIFEVPDRKMIDCVTIDYERYSYEMVSRLISMCHRDIAFIGGGGYGLTPEEYTDNTFFYQHEIRLQGYMKALIDNNIPINKKILKDGKWDIEVAYLKMKEILESGEKVTAVFAAGDKMAIGAIRAILDKKLEVPGDISVIGFDDISISSYIKPPLTTVSYPKEELGRASVKMLLENIKRKKGNSEFNRKIVYDCNIIERDSVKDLNKN